MEHHWRPFLELSYFLWSVINMVIMQTYEVRMTCLLSVILTVILILEVAAFVFVIPSWIWIIDFSEQKEPGSWRGMIEMSFICVQAFSEQGRKYRTGEHTD
jgi:hypothetical protein